MISYLTLVNYGLITVFKISINCHFAKLIPETGTLSVFDRTHDAISFSRPITDILSCLETIVPKFFRA